MSDGYTVAGFQPHLNETFEIVLSSSERIMLQLVEIRVLSTQMPEYSSNDAFALYFLDREHPGSFLPQATYTLEHAALGKLDLFIVPLGPQRDGMRYEVIFT